MIIQCNSCEKKFTVPDSAITAKGRLVQCSSCGNQWTQYPAMKQKKEISKEIINNTKISKLKKVKKTKNIDVYSDEYLQKKHGIKIIDPSSIRATINNKKNKSKKQKKEGSVTFGFYNYLILTSVILMFLFGALNLTKDILIFNFPFLEDYILYFYETLNNINLILLDMIANY